MYIGGALGFGLAGIIGEQWGWRWAFGVPGAVGAAAAIALWRLPRAAPETPAPSGVDWGAAVGAMIRPPLRHAFVGATLALFTSTAFSAWTPTFLHRAYGVSVAEAGIVTGLIFLAGSVAGVMAGGVASDRLLERRADARLWTAAMCLLAAFPAGAGTLLAPSSFLFALGLFPTVLFLTAYTTAITVWLQEIVPQQWRATAMAVALVITQTVGGAAAGAVVGALSDLFGLRQALLIPAAAALAGGLILLRGTRAMPGHGNRPAAVGGQRSAVDSAASSGGVQSD
jgi:predicted MFS family arabinose efflux permease